MAGIVALVACGCGDPEVIAPEVLGVTILPSHGAIGIGTDVEGLVYFTHPLAAEAALDDAIRIDCLPAPACVPAPASDCSTTDPVSTVTYDSVHQVARVRPDTALADDTCYVVVVQAGIEARAADVAALPTDIRSRFRTE